MTNFGFGFNDVDFDSVVNAADLGCFPAHAHNKYAIDI